jgi:two-component system LytT family sensor kinase
MKKSVFYFLHAFVILVFVTLIVMQARGLSTYYKEPLLFNLIDSFLCFGSFLGIIYYSYWLFIPQFLIRKEYLKFFMGLLSIIVGFTLYFNFSALFVSEVLKVKFHVFVKGWWHGIAGYAFALGLAGTFFRLFVQWFKDAYEKNELEKQNFKSELSLLKNQLSPHFLFNTLNNIDSLIIENSPNASLALNKLSEIMRYMVYDSEKELVQLKDEIDYIQNYISLQKLRIPNVDIIKFNIIGDISSKKIAPMLFIPFVENAFKHSSLKDKQGNKIEIKIDVQEKELTFYCFNVIAAINKDKSSGVGLEIIKKRLDMLYKDKYTLSIDNSVKEFIINLNIKTV